MKKIHPDLLLWDPSDLNGVKRMDATEERMYWQEAREEIKNKVKIGSNVNTPASRHRFVEAAGISGFTVRIGTSKSSTVKISWEMLESCFSRLNTPIGYSGEYFRQRYPREAKVHPCHVHVVGQIFVTAGVARSVSNRTYRAR